MDELKIIRNALGRTFKLGDLYDATTDTFINESMFSSSIPEETVTKNHTTFECYSDRFDKISKMSNDEVELEVTFVLPFYF